MNVVPSTMLPLGTQAPDFSLKDVMTGRQVSMSKQPPHVATVVMFICNHCPFVQHIQEKLVEVAENYLQKGVAFIAINSNDYVSYPGDSPDNMKQVGLQMGYPFPYLIDETQEVARACHAACTPDLVVFDEGLKCVYRGRFDGSTPGNGIPITGESLTTALDQILRGEEVSDDQFPSRGCNIKWKD